MKKIIGYMMVLMMVVGLLGLPGSSMLGPGRCIAADMGPVVTMGTPFVKMSKGAEVIIMGTGFKPGQALHILITSAAGNLANIGPEVIPEAKADGTGSFACTWKAGRYISKKLIKGGAYKIEVADSNFNTIAHSVVFFAKEIK